MTLRLYHCSLSLLYTFLLCCACTQENDSKKVLIVASNINEMNGKANGTHMVELVSPFKIFTENGLDVDIVSPQGGTIPIYHIGDTTDAMKAFLLSGLFKYKTENSLTPLEINPAEYSAVLIPGGYGQFWDTYKNDKIKGLIATIYESGGLIGCIGHGAATLIDVKLTSGEYLVGGKTITCYPSVNERAIMQQSNYGKLLPFDMEVELQKRGANLVTDKAANGLCCEIVDKENRIISASYANNAEFVAYEVMKLVKR